MDNYINIKLEPNEILIPLHAKSLTQVDVDATSNLATIPETPYIKTEALETPDGDALETPDSDAAYLERYPVGGEFLEWDQSPTPIATALVNLGYNLPDVDLN